MSENIVRYPCMEPTLTYLGWFDTDNKQGYFNDIHLYQPCGVAWMLAIARVVHVVASTTALVTTQVVGGNLTLKGRDGRLSSRQ